MVIFYSICEGAHINNQQSHFGTSDVILQSETQVLLKPWAFTCRHESPLLIGRCRPSKRVSRWEACEQTAAPADREACEQIAAPDDREACEQTAMQAHREASPLTRLRHPPSSQLLPLLMSPAPQFKINPALPGIATILSLPLRFSYRLPPTCLT